MLGDFSRRAGAVVILIALLTALKGGVFLFLYSRDKAEVFVGDNARDIFIPTAQRLLAEHRFNGPDSRPASKAPPAYPALIAIALKLAPNHFLLVLALMQMLFDAGTALVIYWIGRDYNYPEAGLLAACAWTFFPPVVAISTWVTPEAPFDFFFVAGVRGLLLNIRDHRLAPAVWGGLLMAAATMCRATPMAMSVAVLPVYLWARQWRLWLVFWAMVGLIAGAWTLRNWIVLDDFIPVATGQGAAFLQQSDERFFSIAGKHQNYVKIYAEAAAAGLTKPQSDHDSQVDGYQGRVGLWVYRRRLAERPLSFIPFFARKFVRLWYATESDGLKGELVLGFCSLVVLPGALLQWFVWRRQVPTLAWPLLAIFLYFVALHVVTSALFRYAVPIFPFLLLGAMEYYGRRIRLIRA